MEEMRMADLVEILHKRSVAGKVPWEKTVRDKTYQCSFLQYVVQIRCNSVDNDDYVLIILKEDTVVDSATDEQLNQEMGDPHLVMRDMYVAARRIALGADVAIKAIVRKLREDADEDVPFG